MPSFEQTGHSDKASRVVGNESYSKILAMFLPNPGDQSVAARNSRLTIGFQDTRHFESSLHRIPDDKFPYVAGGDLGSVLYPYETLNESSGIPCFYKDAESSGSSERGSVPNSFNILPFAWDPKSTDKILDRYYASSGDSLPYLVSDNSYRGSADQYRDISDIRGIGQRLPQMGIGWGYTTDGFPWPSGNWNDIPGSGFKGPNGKNLGDGRQIDPSDYVAAPMDWRYDRRRNVWTAPRGFWAKITGCSGYWTPIASGYNPLSPAFYSWQEMVVVTSGFVEASGNWARKGTFLTRPAFEANNNEGVSPGTIVWMKINELTSQYEFDCGLTNEKKDERYTFDKHGLKWDWNIIDWELNTQYIKGFLVQHKQTAHQYICKADHTSDLTNQPPNTDYWESVTTKGVLVKLPMIDKYGAQIETKFYWDSHGQLTYLDTTTDSSSSSKSEEPCCDTYYARFVGTGVDPIGICLTRDDTQEFTIWYDETRNWMLYRANSGKWILRRSGGAGAWYTYLTTWDCPPFSTGEWENVEPAADVGDLIDITCECPSEESDSSSGHKCCDSYLASFATNTADTDDICLFYQSDGMWKDQSGKWSLFRSTGTHKWVLRSIQEGVRLETFSDLHECPPVSPGEWQNVDGNRTLIEIKCDCGSSFDSEDCCPDGYRWETVVCDVHCNDDGTITVTKKTICVLDCGDEGCGSA